MATPPTLALQCSVCRYNKFGFCKFKTSCRKRHVSELCDSSECDISNCEKRHPKNCKFHKYRRCKFGLNCMFFHSMDQNVNEMTDDRVSQLEKDIKKKTEDLDEQKDKISELESRLDNFLNIEKQVNEKNDMIEDLKKRMEMMEKKFNKILNNKESEIKNLKVKTGQLESKIVDIEEAFINKTNENSTVEENQSQFEMTFANPYLDPKCKLCDFTEKKI